MLCLEAICLATLNSEGKNQLCLIEFVNQYPEIASKAIKEHSEYYFDGSLLRTAEKYLTRESKSKGEDIKIFQGSFIDLTYPADDQPYLIGENSSD